MSVKIDISNPENTLTYIELQDHCMTAASAYARIWKEIEIDIALRRGSHPENKSEFFSMYATRRASFGHDARDGRPQVHKVWWRVYFKLQSSVGSFAIKIIESSRHVTTTVFEQTYAINLSEVQE